MHMRVFSIHTRMLYARVFIYESMAVFKRPPSLGELCPLDFWKVNQDMLDVH